LPSDGLLRAQPPERSIDRLAWLRILKWIAVLALAIWLLHLLFSWLRSVLPWA